MSATIRRPFKRPSVQDVPDNHMLRAQAGAGLNQWPTSLSLSISICSVPNSLRPLAPPAQAGLLAARVRKLSVPRGMPVGVRYASSRMSPSSTDLRIHLSDIWLGAKCNAVLDSSQAAAGVRSDPASAPTQTRYTSFITKDAARVTPHNLAHVPCHSYRGTRHLVADVLSQGLSLRNAIC